MRECTFCNHSYSIIILFKEDCHFRPTPHFFSDFLTMTKYGRYKTQEALYHACQLIRELHEQNASLLGKLGPLKFHTWPCRMEGYTKTSLAPPLHLSASWEFRVSAIGSLHCRYWPTMLEAGVQPRGLEFEQCLPDEQPPRLASQAEAHGILKPH